MRPQPRLWSKNFILATVMNFFVSMVFLLLMTSMALYAVDRFGASDSEAGLASSAFIIGAVVARLYAGKFLDLVGRRRMIIAALVVFSIASLLYIPAHDLGLFIGVRLLHGLAFGTAGTAITASTVGLVPASRRGEGMGYFNISVALATAIGPLLAVVLAEAFDFEAVFWVGVGCSVSALIMSLFVRMPERPASAEDRAAMWRFRRSDMVDPDALPIALVVLVAGAAYSGVLSFLTSFAREQDLVAGAIYFFIAYAIAVFVVRLISGVVQDRHGDNVVMYPTLALFTAALVVISFANSEGLFILGAVLLGLGFGGLLPTVLVIAVSSAPDHRVGNATATHYLMLDIGTGFAPILLGLLIPIAGYSGMYLVLAGLTAGGIVLYHFVHGYKRRRPVRSVATPLDFPA